MKRQYIHPFPARMAPELALAALEGASEGALVLDPMVGSGTVIRQASELGLRCYGFDVDPLAVLIARATVSPVDIELVWKLSRHVLNVAIRKSKSTYLRWIDQCDETTRFVSYWFGSRQRESLRKLASALIHSSYNERHFREMDILRVALSKIIITKESGASLARDVSHSRPHRVRDTNNYDVFAGFESAVEKTIKYLELNIPKGGAAVKLGDARKLSGLRKAGVDMVVTSPPYLNAIDYLRGHRLSLVWLGYDIPHLRAIRSDSIGAEKMLKGAHYENVEKIITSFGSIKELPNKYVGIIKRYACDLDKLFKSLHRVVKENGSIVLVIGDSRLKEVAINNSAAIVAAGLAHGFELVSKKERDLPNHNRYLPITVKSDNALSRRMKKESILTFNKISIPTV